MDDFNLDEFMRASNHPYECQCRICQKWWEQVGPEPEGDEDGEDSSHIGDDEIAF